MLYTMIKGRVFNCLIVAIKKMFFGVGEASVQKEGLRCWTLIFLFSYEGM